MVEKNMQSKQSSLTMISIGIFGIIASICTPSHAQSVQFECATDEQNIPTTYAQTSGGIVQIFKWTSTFFNPPYTPIQRCQEVAQRLNQFQPNELVAGRVNSYNVICAGSNCDASGANILLTLRPDQNPGQVLAEIDSTRDAAGGPSMQLGNGSNRGNKTPKTSNLFRTANGSVGLNLSSYIQSAPKIPRNLNGSDNSTAPTLNPSPITSPASQGKPTNSSRGQAW
jgi:hypothetical protein